MKTIYKYLLGIFLGFQLVVVSTSCTDFLNEELIRTDSTQNFETQDGLDKLAIGMYASLEFHYNWEWGFTIWNYGDDEMTVGNATTRENFNSYTNGLDASTGNNTAELLDNMYSGISSANTLIQNVPIYYDPNSSTYSNRLGEAYFIRGFNYFRMVQQMGGVPLLTEPVDGARTDYERNTTEECYAQIISDFKQAYEYLPSNEERTGSLTKGAAAHYIAKVCLFRASEIHDDWNSSYKTQDLADAVEYGKDAIARHPLCNDFVELWDYTEADCPSEHVSEIILSAQFSDDRSTYNRRENPFSLYFPSMYSTLPGFTRDMSGGREFSYLRPTNYSLDVFDRVNDSRFWKSFITTYTCNNPGTAQKWGDYALNMADKSTDDPKYEGGEIGIKYIVNDAGDDRYFDDPLITDEAGNVTYLPDYDSRNINYHGPITYVRYFIGEQQSYIRKHGNYGSLEGGTNPYYVALSKYRDGSRLNYTDQYGNRDGILARSGETYLIVAEALGRQEKYSEALDYINELRKRAGYSEGEDRSKHVDGGQAYKNNPNISLAGNGGSQYQEYPFAAYCETNTYYESNNMEGQETTAETKSNLLFASINDVLNSDKEFYTELGMTSEKDKFITFILNERSRELCGELHRWPDLQRTRQLEKRWRTFNDGSLANGANFNADKHYWRPLPQTFLDAITRNGQALTSDEKSAMQNPGW